MYAHRLFGTAGHNAQRREDHKVQTSHHVRFWCCQCCLGLLVPIDALAQLMHFQPRPRNRARQRPLPCLVRIWVCGQCRVYNLGFPPWTRGTAYRVPRWTCKGSPLWQASDVESVLKTQEMRVCQTGMAPTWKNRGVLPVSCFWAMETFASLADRSDGVWPT